MQFKVCVLFLIAALLLPTGLFAESSDAAAAATVAASRTDGENVYYYANLHEAFESAAGVSVEFPDEITLLTDIVLGEPLQVADNVHIRLVAGNNCTIRRGNSLIEYPVVWVSGENASLTLGKPSMEYELTIDGGYLNEPPIIAHAPLAAVGGPDSKLIMYDNVTLQNNCNIADVPTAHFYRNGGGVFVRTAGDITDHLAEFIMRGGTIRGNINNVQMAMASGGGVQLAGFGIFTMEGGVIMDNIARIHGGGVVLGSRASFKETGGIIYGSNAPLGLRNTALQGTAAHPKVKGHAVSVAAIDPVNLYRNDTVTENDNLSYTGAARGPGAFGEGDKWNNTTKDLQRREFIIIFLSLAAIIAIFLVVMHITLKKRHGKAQTENPATEVSLEDFNLSPREKEIGELLLTELSMREIASKLELTYSGVNFHTKNLYAKLGIQSRTELFAKFGRKINEK